MSLVADQDALAKPEALLRIPVGFASPLWGMFAGAAVSGSAWWWMTRWIQPENLEAMFGAATATLPTSLPQAADAVIMDGDEAAEIAAASAPASEDLPEPITLVGGEAAPISPILLAPPLGEDEAEADEIEDAAALKPRKRGPKAD